MSGGGETVFYTRIVKLAPVDKEQLKKEINDIIDKAANTITVELMVKAPPQATRT